ncbi:MAG TPA: MotA/TolQ/ExbB proton channel family protein [Chlamydiales bacterium]|nr:MotA/TolQ/ExbB proton channel family protein [Chlamydiales bacterium]
MFAAGNPFVNAYLHTDWLGKGIFWLLFVLSGITWTILIHKGWVFFHVKRLSRDLLSQFSHDDPLSLQFNRPVKGVLLEVPHPLFEIYKSFKAKALAIISRNHLFMIGASFSMTDIELLESEMFVAIRKQMRNLEKHLYILPTIANLGPFIGLLGTVWGILISFSQMQSRAGNEGLLAGLSLALATTVIGLLVAIPALVGNNYFKNAVRSYAVEMDEFTQLLISSIEIHYARGEHAKESVH